MPRWEPSPSCSSSCSSASAFDPPVIGVPNHNIRNARLFQSPLIPAAPFRGPSIEIAFRFTPFFEVGEHFVDFFRLPDGMIGLYMGDVVGKGPPATMYGALVIGTLRGIHKS